MIRNNHYNQNLGSIYPAIYTFVSVWDWVLYWLMGTKKGISAVGGVHMAFNKIWIWGERGGVHMADSEIC